MEPTTTTTDQTKQTLNRHYTRKPETGDGRRGLGIEPSEVATDTAEVGGFQKHVDRIK
jgi:hypothetical protein